MIPEVTFYLLVTLSQRQGIQAEPFGDFTECMTALAAAQRENDDLLGANRCDKITLYPNGEEPKEEEGRSRDYGTYGQ